MLTYPRAFLRETSTLPALPPAGPPVTDGDLATLPEPARRYLRFMGVVGRPRVRSFRAALSGHFRPSLTSPWMPCRAWQYNASPAIARIFRMKLRFGGFLPVVGHDTYVDGHGRMLVKALDLFPVQDVRGAELDQGELVTWLDDAVLVAPSMLLGHGVTFHPVDGDAFALRLEDHGVVVRARVTVDDEGRPVDFETTDRFLDGVRTRWTTPIDAWSRVDGRAMATRGRAIWHRPEPFCYGELTVGPVEFDVPPGGA